MGENEMAKLCNEDDEDFAVDYCAKLVLTSDTANGSYEYPRDHALAMMEKFISNADLGVPKRKLIDFKRWLYLWWALPAHKDTQAKLRMDPLRSSQPRDEA